MYVLLKKYFVLRNFATCFGRAVDSLSTDLKVIRGVIQWLSTFLQ